MKYVFAIILAISLFLNVVLLLPKIQAIGQINHRSAIDSSNATDNESDNKVSNKKESKISNTIESTGYVYNTNDDDYTPLKYTKSYSDSAGVCFITTYKLYHPYKGYHYRTIKAKHYKTRKYVLVDIIDPTSTVLSEINIEETKYDTASSKPFGERGVGSLFSSRIPNQLEVRFLDNGFKNVLVMNVLEYEGSRQCWYILDK